MSFTSVVHFHYFHLSLPLFTYFIHNPVCTENSEPQRAGDSNTDIPEVNSVTFDLHLGQRSQGLSLPVSPTCGMMTEGVSWERGGKENGPTGGTQSGHPSNMIDTGVGIGPAGLREHGDREAEGYSA